ncbi:hypothetical protein BDN72DRAFT_896242 [Pluteus cervinus]|uniref:Uncharacterized protein n=1 Tax=Pluteus cervinus TaxID=181527 RepID=A0ACD3AZB0_9AGAR|nr:hypothetical protein BDN72DRAFT_896242 [Pluteus cervinus]
MPPSPPLYYPPSYLNTRVPLHPQPPQFYSPQPHISSLQTIQQMSHIELSLALASLTSVHHMPAEILHEIFEWSITGLEPHEYHTFDTTAFCIAHVSRLWRYIALRSPRLWANMAVFHPSSAALKLIEVYLSRAGSTTLLKLHLSQREAYHSDYLIPGKVAKYRDDMVHFRKAILDLWLSYSTRWQSIDFDFGENALPSPLMEAQPERLPYLQDVILRHRNLTAMDDKIYEEFWNRIHKLPMLRNVHWQAAHCISTAPFEQLTACSLPMVSLNEAYEVLRQCRRLESLTADAFMECFGDSELDPSSDPPVALPYLRVLRLNNMAYPAGMLNKFLKNILTPRLEELTILWFPEKVPQRILANFLKRSRCRLRSLILDHTSADKQIVGVLRVANEENLLDSLERLDLRGHYSDNNVFKLFYAPFEGDKVPQIPFPSLLSLKIGSCVPPRDGKISRMLLSRAKARRRLRVFACLILSFGQMEYPKDGRAIERLEKHGSVVKVTHNSW